MDERKDRAIRYLQADLQQRRRPARGPRKMGDAIHRLMTLRGYAQRQTTAQCEAAWREAVGSRLAGHSQAGAVRRGVLQVTVRNSAVMQELCFQKKKLLQQLARLAPDQRIQDLRFRVGPLPGD